VVTNTVGMWAWLNTTYRCVSPASVAVGGATVTFSGVRMEAYMTQEDLSPAGNTAHVFVKSYVDMFMCSSSHAHSFIINSCYMLHHTGPNETITDLVPSAREHLYG